MSKKVVHVVVDGDRALFTEDLLRTINEAVKKNVYAIKNVDLAQEDEPYCQVHPADVQEVRSMTGMRVEVSELVPRGTVLIINRAALKADLDKIKVEFTLATDPQDETT